MAPIGAERGVTVNIMFDRKNMKKTNLALVVLALTFTACSRQSTPTETPPDPPDHTAWVISCMEDISAFQAGMMRHQLSDAFSRQCGYRPNPAELATYEYRKCPYIKVDVTFKHAGDRDGPDDVIVCLSKPYLGYMVID